MSKVDNIKKFIKENKKNIKETTKNLINISSDTGNEAEMAAEVKKIMKRFDYDEIKEDSLGNVIGRIGEGSKKIIFDAHMDTVPSGDDSNWTTDPYQGTFKGDKLYGRGACDDKGSLVSFLYTGKAIKKLNLADEFTVYISASIMEETCEGVALGKMLDEQNIDPDFAVVGEPSDFKICRGHRGRMLLEAVFSGKSVHASVHEDDNHAIYKATPFIEAVKDLNKRLPEDPVLGKGDICVTKVEVETNSLNSTPTKCRVIMDRRTTTVDSKDSVLKELSELSGAEEAEISLMTFNDETYKGSEIKAEEYFPAWILDEKHELIEAGKKAFEEYYREKPNIDVWGFSTNGNYTMGKAGIPTLGFGPGKGENCHINDEYIDINDVAEAIGFYSLLPKNLS